MGIHRQSPLSEMDTSCNHSRVLATQIHQLSPVRRPGLNCRPQRHSSWFPTDSKIAQKQPPYHDEQLRSLWLLYSLATGEFKFDEQDQRSRNVLAAPRPRMRPPRIRSSLLSPANDHNALNTGRFLLNEPQPQFRFTIMPRKSNKAQSPLRKGRVSKPLSQKSTAVSTSSNALNDQLDACLDRDSRHQSLSQLSAQSQSIQSASDEHIGQVKLRIESPNRPTDISHADQTISDETIIKIQRGIPQPDSQLALPMPTAQTVSNNNLKSSLAKRRFDDNLAEDGINLRPVKRVRIVSPMRSPNDPTYVIIHENIRPSESHTALLSKADAISDTTDCASVKPRVRKSSPSQQSSSSELSDPPVLLGPTPVGLISLDNPLSKSECDHNISKGNAVRRSNRVRKASVRAMEAQKPTSLPVSKMRRCSNAVQNTTQPPEHDSQTLQGPLVTNDNAQTKKRKLDELDTAELDVNSLGQPLNSRKKQKISDTTQQSSTTAIVELKSADSGQTKRRVLRSGTTKTKSAADTMEDTSQQTNADVYASDAGARKSQRGSGRGGRGGHTGRGRGGRGRGGGAPGRGRGDSPERPVKHILTSEERTEIARLKKRQGELRNFFNYVGSQQTEILDVLAGRDLLIITRKAKAHEKFPDYEEVVDDLAFYRDQKMAQIRRQFELDKQLAMDELENTKQLIEQQFKTRVEHARQEHIDGAAGDLAIFKKAIAAGGDDAYTVAGSEADYFPRYHELPEANANVRGYNSGKIVDEKPFRHELPSFDEVAARDVMEDEVTRPVVEALHRKRAEEQALIAREQQAQLEEEAREQTQTIEALGAFAVSEQGQNEIADVNDYLDPRSMRAPQYGSFGLSALADAVEGYTRPLPVQQYNPLPPPNSNRSYPPSYPPMETQQGRSLHFPPAPPKLYIPQHPLPPPPPPPPPHPTNYTVQDPALPSAITTPVAVQSPASFKPIAPAGPLPALHQQPNPISISVPPSASASARRQSKSLTPTSASAAATANARRSLRSIAPQPPPPALSAAGAPHPPPQTYTFVPPQQLPQPLPPLSAATGHTRTSSTSSTPTTTNMPSSIAFSGTSLNSTNGAHPNNQIRMNNTPPLSRELGNVGVNNIRFARSTNNSQSQINTQPPALAQQTPNHNQHLQHHNHNQHSQQPQLAAAVTTTTTAAERRTSGPKQGQGKISMQFFNSIIDGNGKRALLPKP